MISTKRTPKELLGILLKLVFIVTILVNIKSIFTDYDVDSQYAISMSYRMLRGDQMFLQMWEPHQTSAFLCTFLMWIYMIITGTTTGVAIFLHIMGVLFQGLVAFAVYQVMKSRVDDTAAVLMSLFFLADRPKDISFPEFSNMQMWFSVLLFLCLILYFENQKIRWLLVGSFCLCLEIISYPSCLLAYPVVLVLLLIYSKEKVRDAILFSVFCAVQGCAYVLFFVLRIGGKIFLESLQYILHSDESHSGLSLFGEFWGWQYYTQYIWWALICIVAAVLTERILSKWRKDLFAGWAGGMIPRVLLCFWGWLMVADVIGMFLIKGWWRADSLLYVVMTIGALAGLRFCNESEKKIVLSGVVLSLASFFATALLTNLDALMTLKYMMLAVMVSFVSITKTLQHLLLDNKRHMAWLPVLGFCVTILFHRGYQIKTLGDSDSNIFSMSGIVKSGPECGLLMNYMGAYSENITHQEWQNYVKPDDRVLLACPNTIMYLYEDVEISTNSTLCTATFDQMQEKYWELNPEKKPNVIVFECWYGDMKSQDPEWMLQWISEQPGEITCTDGQYYRYYRIQE
uniref:hypothetical protein n=1 Tax=Acetatifactor sp. TaxID=1872090 RepID=UPI004056D233